MNETIIKNWNGVVTNNDIVYFLGDMKCGGKTDIDYWLEQLNGKIFYIQGNHDMNIITKATVLPNKFLIYRDKQKFLLMHEPVRPEWFKGWIIHGHIHNNDLINYPFINKEKKTVNVSVELTNYTPVNLDVILEKIKNV